MITNEEFKNKTISELSPNKTKECYVCYNDCNTLSPCNCKTLYLHKDCQIKLLTSKNDNFINNNNNTLQINQGFQINQDNQINQGNLSIECSICKANYNNVLIKITNNKVISNTGLTLILMFMTIFSLFVGSLVSYIYLFTTEEDDFKIIVMIILYSSSLLLLSLFFQIFYYKCFTNTFNLCNNIQKIEYHIQEII